jgi:hypothetical protein
MKQPNTQLNSRRLVLPIGLIIVSLLLIGTARILGSANRLVSDVRAMQSMMKGSDSAESPANQFEKLDTLFNQTTQDFRDLRSTIGPLVYLGPLLGWIPNYGGDLANVPALFDLGEQTIVGAQSTMIIGRTLNDEMEKAKTTGGSAGVALLKVAQSQQSEIQKAKTQLPQIRAARARVDASLMSPANQALLHQFDEVLALWLKGLDAFEIAPKWLGADRPRVYLLVAQNSDELRPTGGFVTGVSLLRVNQGKITVGDFQDSYLVDDLTKTHPPAPEPLLSQMYAWQWMFRDSNWSPDFPTSALQMQALYQFDRGLATDGVIAVNLGTVARLLDALGPVTVDPYNEQVDATNVLDRIQAYWASPQRLGTENERWQQRKDFVGRLFEAITRRLMSGDFNRVRMGRVLYDIALAKDVLVYSNDIPDIESGSLYTGKDDALMIVDANLGFNKVDGNVSRQAEYAITRNADGSMHVELSVTYTNLSPARESFCVHQPFYVGTYEELEQGCYWDYVRIVVPAGSQLTLLNTDLKPATEVVVPGRISFGGFFLLERGARRTIQFKYTLPPGVASASNYTLHLEKQPGAPPIPVLVHLTLPEGIRMRAVEPTAESQQGNELFVPVMLDRDQDVVFVSDPSSSTGWLQLALGLVVLVFVSVVAWVRLHPKKQALVVSGP